MTPNDPEIDARTQITLREEARIEKQAVANFIGLSRHDQAQIASIPGINTNIVPAASL